MFKFRPEDPIPLIASHIGELAPGAECRMAKDKGYQTAAGRKRNKEYLQPGQSSKLSAFRTINPLIKRLGQRLLERLRRLATERELGAVGGAFELAVQVHQH